VIGGDTEVSEHQVITCYTLRRSDLGGYLHPEVHLQVSEHRVNRCYTLSVHAVCTLHVLQPAYKGR
jgi:hypothetical protein